VHIHFCTPCYNGQISEPTFRSYVKQQALLTKVGIDFSISTLFNESLVTRARNTCVAFMMGNPVATHLMFVDADIEWDASDVINLINADKDVIGGTYPKKTINWMKVQLQAMKDAAKAQGQFIHIAGAEYVVNAVANQTGNIIEVEDIGAGFLMIKREVIQKMFVNYAHLKYKNTIGLDSKYDDLCYALFDTMLVNNHYLSEDYGFCYLWKQLGGIINLDKSINLGHYGSYMFKGNPANI
tara:strand:+ start:670 stop:1389 length:720 start_codon:yes stop_codon:yes gene_type:complete